MPKTINHIAPFLFVLLLAILILPVAGCEKAPAAGPGAVLGHPLTPEFVVTAPPVTLASGDMPSTDKHSAKGVGCEKCHGDAMPTSAPTSNKACLDCHKHETLVKATAKYDDVKHKSQNPHESHMHGTSCMSCHKNHGESVLACDQCHVPKFGWKVP
jgi:hypothetical protein